MSDDAIIALVLAKQYTDETAFGEGESGGSGGGVTVHNDLTGRSAADSHPISAITGLSAQIDGKIGAVAHGADLTGDGTTAAPLSVAPITLEDSENNNLPSLDSETVAAKTQEFYSLCKWLKNNMLVKVGYWPRMVLAFMQNGNTIAALNATTGFAIEPLTEADRNGWTITLDNSRQGGEGANGVLRLVYNSGTDWYVEGRPWYEEGFNTVLRYSAELPGYEMVGDFDGNGGAVSDVSGDIANSSVAKVLYPESEFTVDFRKLLDELTVTKISNNVLKGINTFMYPPQVPTPYSGNDAVNKAYVDAAIAAALGN